MSETRETLAAALRDAWDEICADTNCHPMDITSHRRQMFFSPGHWVELAALRFDELSTASLPKGLEPVAWRARLIDEDGSKWLYGPYGVADISPRFNPEKWHVEPLYSLPSNPEPVAWQPIETLKPSDDLILAACPPCSEFPDGRVMIWKASMLPDNDRTPRHLRFPATLWTALPMPPWSLPSNPKEG